MDLHAGDDHSLLLLDGEIAASFVLDSIQSVLCSFSLIQKRMANLQRFLGGAAP